MHQVVSRSFAFVAICAIITVVMFVVVLDVLKYGFGIDSSRDDRKQMLKKEAKTPIGIRFVYVNLPINPN